MEHFKKETDAIIAAKINAIRKMEKFDGVEVHDNVYIDNDDLWLIKQTTVMCNCGETSGIDVTLFDFISNNQFNGKVGICYECGI